MPDLPSPLSNALDRRSPSFYAPMCLSLTTHNPSQGRVFLAVQLSSIFYELKHLSLSLATFYLLSAPWTEYNFMQEYQVMECPLVVQQ